MSRSLESQLRGIRQGEIRLVNPRFTDPPKRPRYTLGAHPVIPYWSIWLHEKDGEVAQAYTLGARSFTRWIADALEVWLAGRSSNQTTVKDTGGTDRTTATSATNLSTNWIVAAGGGVVTHGIVVGTGTDAEAITNNALQTLIAHGTGSGQLSYGAVAVGAATAVGSSAEITVTRSMTNGSGSIVTAQEFGLYIQFTYTTSTTGFFCGVRDLIEQAVNNGQVLTAVLTLAFPN
jgi:hypothetical protein